MSQPETTQLPPARFAFDAVTWKEIAYLLANLPVDIAGFVYVVVMLYLGIGLSVTVVGVPMLALGLAGAGSPGGWSGAGRGGCWG